MSKYDPLARYLLPATMSSVTLGFGEIEGILGFPLPPSAREHRPWWANDPSHSYTVWLELGWETRDVDMRSERVTFVRAANEPRDARVPQSIQSHQLHRHGQPSDAPSLAATREFSGFRFVRVCSMEPECGSDGRPRQYLPQSRYRNSAGLPLHRYGAGPFCSFSIPANPHVAGVYLILVDDSVHYVGQCQNLSERFSSRGYGQIHPRNCFERGQPTNCRLNNLILDAAKQGHRIDLWLHGTAGRYAVERQLIADLAPPWNRTY